MIDVFVVNKSLLMSSVTAAVVKEEPEMQVVGTATSKRDALEQLRKVSSDVVLISTNLHEEAVELVRAIRAEFSARPVMVGLSGSQDTILCMIEAGVAGYVLRDGAVDDLIRTIHLAYEGQADISPAIAAAMLERIAQLAESHPERETMPQHMVELSAREQEVLDLISRGLSNREIASRLVVEVGTVKNHAHSIYRKLEVDNREDAARYWHAYQRD